MESHLSQRTRKMGHPAFQKVGHPLPADAPIILESRVEESEVDEEIETAIVALTPAKQFAIASD